MRRVWAAERLSGIPAPIPGVVGESILWVGGGGREFEKVVRAVHLNAAPRGCEIESHRKGFQAGCVSKKSVKGKICTIEFFEQALGRWTLPLFRRAGGNRWERLGIDLQKFERATAENGGEEVFGTCRADVFDLREEDLRTAASRTDTSTLVSF